MNLVQIPKTYRPIDNISNVEAKGEMAKLKFYSKVHPEKYFMHLSILKNKYPKSNRFDKEELIPLTLAKSPDEYKSVMTAESQVKAHL